MSDFINTTDALGDDAVCDGIITKTLTEYAESHITTIGDYAFYNCNKLAKLDLPNATSIGVFAFYGCSTMKTINLPVVTLIDNYAFYNGYALESVNTPLVTEIGKSAFRYCTKLASIDLPSAILIDSYAFYNCTSLTAVVLRSETMCELTDTNAFANTPIADGTGYIYVPKTLVEAYQNGTNWSLHFSQFRAIEDYPDIIGG